MAKFHATRVASGLIMGLTLVATVTACGGGGSSSPTPTATPAHIQSINAQRVVTSQALSSVRSTQTLYQYAGVGSAPTAVSRALAKAYARTTAAWRANSTPQTHRKRAGVVTYSACNSGFEEAYITVSATEDQVYERLFYDAACTELWQDIFIDAVSTSSTAATAEGTDAVYTVAGTQYDYETLLFAINGIGTGSGEFALEIGDAAVTGGPERAALGIACYVGTSSLACGFGELAHAASISEDVAALLSESVSLGTATGGVVNIPVSGSASGYVSGLNTLGLTTGSTFPNWAITGGSPFDTATVSGQLSYNQSTGALTGGTLTLTDSADGGTVTATASGSPAQISGTVTQTNNGQTVATFTVDAAGNGTLTYSNGTTAQIVGWIVLG